MGSSKKHKKESKKHKRRSRSRSPHEKRSRSYSVEGDIREVDVYDRARKDVAGGGEKAHRHKKHKRDRSEQKHRKIRKYVEGNGELEVAGSSRRHKSRREREYVEVDDDSDSK